MRIYERIFSGDVNKPTVWQPVFVKIGSNIVGRKFKLSTASFSLQEMIKYNHPDKHTKLYAWLHQLESCGVGE